MASNPITPSPKPPEEKQETKASTKNPPEEKPVQLHNVSVDAEKSLATVKLCRSRTSKKPEIKSIETKTFAVTCESGPSARPAAVVDNCLCAAHAKNTYCNHFKLNAASYRLRVELAA